QEYYNLTKRQGVTEAVARRRLLTDTTLIGAMMLRHGDADALVCGTFGSFDQHFDILEQVIGYENKDNIAAAMNAMILPQGNLFITDTYVNDDPDAYTLSRITAMAADEMRHFGIKPQAALLANSNFGAPQSDVGRKMSEALKTIRQNSPELEIDGEMQGDAALLPEMRKKILPDTTLHGSANLLVMPNIQAANISYNLLRVSAADGVTIGPILMGIAKPCHIVTPISSVRRIINMVAIAVVDAQREQA
ncbi:MAG: NADP-dependent malic enzyme, partial [Neisseriaceae bacterium]|nr:NADP-dependent malic enzyme [Neisseriaceae bacterium]